MDFFIKLKHLPKMMGMFENWPVYLADYFKLIRKNYLVYKLKNGVRYKIRPNTFDRVAITETWIFCDYTPKGFEIKENDVVVDVGAQIGAFSIFAAKSNARVYAFEPVPENYRLLKENIALNSAKNIMPMDKAVLSRKQTIKIILSPGHTGGHSQFLSSFNDSYLSKGKEEYVEAESVSLLDFVAKNKIRTIDFLKMDCEGAEYDILFNCPDSVLDKIKKISMEYHFLDEKRNSSTLKSFLEKKGFEVTAIPSSPKVGMLYALKEN